MRMLRYQRSALRKPRIECGARLSESWLDQKGHKQRNISDVLKLVSPSRKQELSH